MKKIIIQKFILLTIITTLFIVFGQSNVHATEPNIPATAALVMDANTGNILYGKNEYDKMYPASITKIMTAILVIENLDLNTSLVASSGAVNSIPSGYSIAYLNSGEVVPVSDLLKMLMVISANDAANVLAEGVGDSLDNFASLMNEKALELNMTSTNFTNAYGLHDENHYSSAHDLAILMQYCISNPTFVSYASISSCTIPATNSSDVRTYNTTNGLLIPTNSAYYEFTTAGKTGYTTAAGNCLISSATQNDFDLICVVLNVDGSDPSVNKFTVSKTLFEYVFSIYDYVELLEKGTVFKSIDVSNATNGDNELDLVVSNSIMVPMLSSDASDIPEPIVEINTDIFAPIKEGDTLRNYFIYYWKFRLSFSFSS